MKKRELDFIIDRLTDSIVNIFTGDSFQTEVSLLTKEELKTINKKNNWNFDWGIDYRDLTKEVFKLTITSSPSYSRIGKYFKEKRLYRNEPFRKCSI